jgi:hypothetical protein
LFPNCLVYFCGWCMVTQNYTKECSIHKLLEMCLLNDCYLVQTWNTYVLTLYKPCHKYFKDCFRIEV